LTTIAYGRDTLYHLRVGGTIIDVTSDHPFFVKGKWVATKNLNIGDSMELYSGKNATLEKVSFTVGKFAVYNFTVEDFHTYYVSGENILVHNGGPCDIVKSNKQLIKEQQLPNKGKIRFVPKEKDLANGKLSKKDGGFVDRFDNVWKKGPSRTEGQAFEWDVQLYKPNSKYKHPLKWLSPSGKHVNVSLDGEVTH
jgi:hypothetical protein